MCLLAFHALGVYYGYGGVSVTEATGIADSVPFPQFLIFSTFLNFSAVLDAICQP